MPRGGSAPCAPGCACKRHSYQPARGIQKKCEPGCECRRHTAPKEHGPCKDGCTCGRHRGREFIARNQRRVLRAMRTFNLTYEQLTDMFSRQASRCYACGAEISRDVFTVDHDHGCCPGRSSCGKCVIGLACNRCNMGFGCFNDDPVLMMRAASARAQRMRELFS
jgi:hypothetical protein